jgi:phage RecT family recombinase
MPSASPVRRATLAPPRPSRNGNGSALATAAPANSVFQQRQQPGTSEIISLLSDPRVKEQMKLALPGHVTADRLARIVMTEVRKEPKLLRCDKASFLGAVMQACALGLEPGINGSCYLIPYGSTCTFVPGWKGLVELATNTGRASVWTGAVFEGDEFDYALGDRPFVHHRPGEEIDPDKLSYVYAIGRVNGSECPVIEVWTMPKVWRHRDKINKQGQKHYSYRHPEMYARKVVLLQVLKYLPSSPELAKAMELQRQEELGSAQDLPLNHLVSGSLPNGNGAAAALPEAQAEPVVSAQQVTQLETAIVRKLSVVGEAALLAELEAEGIEKLEDLPVSRFDPLFRQLATTAVITAWNEGRDSTGEPILSQEQINEIIDADRAAQEEAQAQADAEAAAQSPGQSPTDAAPAAEEQAAFV